MLANNAFSFLAEELARSRHTHRGRCFGAASRAHRLAGMSSKVPWTSIREFKDNERKRKEEQQQQVKTGTKDQQTLLFSQRFSGSKFRERLTFGAIVGAVTGAAFGGLDAVQASRKGHAFGQNLNTMQEKVRFGVNMLGTSALVFSMFYAGFQGTKYVIRIARDEKDFGNALMAGAVTVAPMMFSATFRRNVPYAVILIGMDVFSDMQ